MRKVYDLEEEDERRERKKVGKMNREMAVVTYLVIILFIVMAGYVIWFLVQDNDYILNNSANKRQDLLAKRIIKGSIYSDEGQVLAKTETNSNGNDSRVYPYGELYAHAIGRSSKGRTGLEASYSYTMLTTGINPIKGLINQFKGVKNPGNDVYTTLNTSLQEVASQALGTRKGAVIIMDPYTGKILALVSKPSYDPNTIDKTWDSLTAESDQESALYNRATMGLYPPGSTFKMYTTLEFMRENKDYKKFSYTCKGSYGKGKNKIKCYGGNVHGTLDLETAFAKSCNSTFAKIGSSLDVSKWKRTCEKFYFNKTIPTDFENKASSFTLEESEDNGEEAQAGIGQGTVLVSPLQNILLVNAIANGGKLMKPYMVEYVKNTSGGIVQRTEPTSLDDMLTKAEVKELRKCMRATVTSGTATSLLSSNYEAYGKTGSAQFINGSDLSHSWFVGYAKTPRRTLSISVIVERGGTGSEAAVPIARRVFDTLV